MVLQVLTISEVRARPSAGIGVVDVQKRRIFTISEVRARLSARIGVVDVQSEVFLRFLRCRATHARICVVDRTKC